MLPATARPATPLRPPTTPAAEPAQSWPATTARPGTFTAGGLRVLVTDTPATADAAHACTPVMAAWLIATGAAVALIDESGRDRRQWLHLPAPHARDRTDLAEPTGRGPGEELLAELYAERFTPTTPARPARRGRR